MATKHMQACGFRTKWRRFEYMCCIGSYETGVNCQFSYGQRVFCVFWYSNAVTDPNSRICCRWGADWVGVRNVRPPRAGAPLGSPEAHIGAHRKFSREGQGPGNGNGSLYRGSGAEPSAGSTGRALVRLSGAEAESFEAFAHLQKAQKAIQGSCLSIFQPSGGGASAPLQEGASAPCPCLYGCPCDMRRPTHREN